MRTETYLYARDDNGERSLWEPPTTISKDSGGNWNHDGFLGLGPYDKGLVADDFETYQQYYHIRDILGDKFHGLRKGRKMLIRVHRTEPVVVKV